MLHTAKYTAICWSDNDNTLLLCSVPDCVENATVTMRKLWDENHVFVEKEVSQPQAFADYNEFMKGNTHVVD